MYPTNAIGYLILYCNKFKTVFTQIIHLKEQAQRIKHFNHTVQYLEKYGSTVQGWHIGLVSSEKAGRIADWRRERGERWKS